MIKTQIRKSILLHITAKLLKTKATEQIFKAAREKPHIIKHGNNDPINGFLLLGCNVGDMESWWESADSVSGRDKAQIPRGPRGLIVHQKE